MRESFLITRTKTLRCMVVAAMIALATAMFAGNHERSTANPKKKTPEKVCRLELVEEGIKLEKRANGKLYFENGAGIYEIIRYLSPEQQNNKVIQGYKLYFNGLEEKRPLNAAILRALVSNPGLIPNEWKDGRTYFWGTIATDPDGNSFVEGLYWHNKKWNYCANKLAGNWDAHAPAACLTDMPSDR